ncbi:MAG: putative baseplate assembly protein [Candidatus Rokuibacteriota bacterium]|nr:MAG: putative baseplate assembly protein [Candidatus Rokubacteria bacterium]
MNDGACACGCCEGIQVVTPRPIGNRPGLYALYRRVGEYADFYETLLARLSTQWVDVETDQTGPHGEMLYQRIYPLRDLRTRSTDDLTIALLDGWAVSLDVLTFYSERIANEGYLRTAGELRSLIDLARLVGYRRRPGVSASVYLAFTADDAAVKASGLVLPTGARVQSVPDPGATPETFETDAPLVTRPDWNVLTPRQVRPAYLAQTRAESVGTLYFDGTSTGLGVGSALLLVYGDGAGEQVLRFVQTVAADFDHGRTAVTLQGGAAASARVAEPAALDVLVSGLEKPPSIPPASPARLALTTRTAFNEGSASADALLARFHPEAAKLLPLARANATATPSSSLSDLFAFRVKASVYAHTAPRRQRMDENRVVDDGDWLLRFELRGDPPNENTAAKNLRTDVVDLDTVYDAILPSTWVAIIRPNAKTPALRRLIAFVKEVQTVSRTSYQFPAKVTRLILDRDWIDKGDRSSDGEDKTKIFLSAVRSAQVYAAPEALPLADEPVETPVCGQEIELDRLVDGLAPSRWLIVTGERADPGGGDAFPVEGVPASELVMLEATRQDTLYVLNDSPISITEVANQEDPEAAEKEARDNPLPGDSTHTFLTLSAPLAYCYKRDTIKVYANVAHATHGETQVGALGTGDGGQTFQTFDLKGTPPPLTYTAAVGASGVDSSLAVYVNDVRWHEAENILDLGPATRGFLTVTDDKEKTSVKFGDGVNGARLPTATVAGQENVRAVYRRGLGKPGNVRDGQITRLVANTDGMRAVVNPQAATGGADPDGADRTRRRAPLAVTALDRLVAVEDYADFSRLFAGIAKASAARLPTRHGFLVHVTIAGVDDIPIDPTSDLYRSLLTSLEQLGDPYLPVMLERRALSLLVISATVRIDPDYQWETVEAAIRAAMLDYFGFERRELGQDAYAAEAIAVMQAVAGVVYVDLDLFAAVPESTPPEALLTIATALLAQGVKPRIAASPDRLDPESRTPLPAQLVMLSPDVPTTLLLSQIPDE